MAYSVVDSVGVVGTGHTREQTLVMMFARVHYYKWYDRAAAAVNSTCHVYLVDPQFLGPCHYTKDVLERLPKQCNCDFVYYTEVGARSAPRSLVGWVDLGFCLYLAWVFSASCFVVPMCYRVLVSTSEKQECEDVRRVLGLKFEPQHGGICWLS